MFVFIAHFKDLKGSVFHHYRRTADNSYRISDVDTDIIQKGRGNPDRSVPLFVSFINCPVGFKFINAVQPVKQRFINTVCRCFGTVAKDYLLKIVLNMFQGIEQ